MEFPILPTIKFIFVRIMSHRLDISVVIGLDSNYFFSSDERPYPADDVADKIVRFN